MGTVIKWPRQIMRNQPGPTHESSTDESRFHHSSSPQRQQIHNHHVVDYYYDILHWCTFKPYSNMALLKCIDELRHQRGLPR